MKITSLSASALKVWLACEASGAGQYVEKSWRGESGEAADLGTAIHEALDRFVELDPLKMSGPVRWATLGQIWVDIVGRAFLPYDQDRIRAEGEKLLERWLLRQNWDDWLAREVVSREDRKTWDIPLDDGSSIPFVYIIDRLDRDIATGDLSVVDYKSGFFMLTRQQLKDEVQALSYATAMWLENPTQTMFWVTFDYLRGEEVSVGFRASECEKFYEYIVERANYIINKEEDPEEKINAYCRFCPRKHECETLNNQKFEPLPYLWTVESLADRKAHLAWMKTAIAQAEKEIDKALAVNLEEMGIAGVEGESGAVVELVQKRGNRSVDAQALGELIGYEALAAMASVTVGSVEELAANTEDDELRSQIMGCLKSGGTSTAVKVTEKAKTTGYKKPKKVA